MRPVQSKWPCGRRIPNEAAPTPKESYHCRKKGFTYPEGNLDDRQPSVHTEGDGQRTTTTLDSRKSRAVWQPIRAAGHASPVSLGMSLYVNHSSKKEMSVGLCPITEYVSAWIADPTTGLFHDASSSECFDCFAAEPGLLALTPSFGSADPTHGFIPCAHCFGTAGHASHAGRSK
jgi:hypothetical protein